jgi:hypothetical protein
MRKGQWVSGDAFLLYAEILGFALLILTALTC